MFPKGLFHTEFAWSLRATFMHHPAPEDSQNLASCALLARCDHDPSTASISQNFLITLVFVSVLYKGEIREWKQATLFLGDG